MIENLPFFKLFSTLFLKSKYVLFLFINSFNDSGFIVFLRLIIFSLFLLASVLTFSAQDNVVNIFNENTTYQNNFGYIGALFSNSLFSYIGLSAYYFCLVNFYFGMVMFFTEPSKTFSLKKKPKSMSKLFLK